MALLFPIQNFHHYIVEDDAILVGPGMLRGKIDTNMKTLEEASYTYSLTKYLLEIYPQKRFVFDAGALQMMEKEWLKKKWEKIVNNTASKGISANYLA